MLPALDDLLTRALDDHDEPPVPWDDPLCVRVLDAAAELFGQFGIRRTTIDDIARRAGVGRVTIYRRIGQKEQLVEAVLLREALGMIASIDRAVVGIKSPEERMVEGFLCLLRQMRDGDHVLGRLLAVEPETVLPYVTRGWAPFLRVSIDYMAPFIRRSRPEPGRAEAVAELFARFTHSLMLTPGGGTPFEDEESARAFAQAAIVPLIAA